MKITKRQLKRIIKEEKQKLVNENAQGEQLNLLHDTINRLWEIMGPEELANELEGIAEEIRSEAGRGAMQGREWTG